jgi:hypothetical protein
VAGTCLAPEGVVPVAVGASAVDQRFDGCCVAGQGLAVVFVVVCRRAGEYLILSMCGSRGA